MEGSLQHWFGSLTVMYDGDPHAPSAPLSGPAITAATAATVGAVCNDKADGPHTMAAAAPQGHGHSKASKKHHHAADTRVLPQEQLQSTTTAASPASPAEAVNGPAGGDGDNKQQQQPERYMFGFQPHGLYPTGQWWTRCWEGRDGWGAL